MKVLAIGGTGFIGSYAVRDLLEQGHDVAVLHRGATKPPLSPEVRHIHGDRDHLADSKPELVRFGPEIVLDVIPYTERQARNLLALCRGLARRIVALSSADVYRNYDGFRGKPTAPPDPVPLSEDAPLRENLYPYRGTDVKFEWADDYEKILVERILLGETDLSAVVLRLPAVYGPGDKQHRIGACLRRLEEGTPVPMTRQQAEWRWTRGYVENIAAAIAHAVTDGREGRRVYNIGEKSALTEQQWLQQIAEAGGWSGNVTEVREQDIPGQPPFDYRYELTTDTTRFRNELSYTEPIARSEAIRRTVEWEQSRNAA